jgi:hypothetical protein
MHELACLDTLKKKKKTPIYFSMHRQNIYVSPGPFHKLHSLVVSKSPCLRSPHKSYHYRYDLETQTVIV